MTLSLSYPSTKGEPYYSTVRLGPEPGVLASLLSTGAQQRLTDQLSAVDAFVASPQRISAGADAASFQEATIRNGLSAVGPVFEWSIAEALWQIEQENPLLRETLDEIAPRNSTLTQRRQRAEHAYRSGNIQDALEDLLILQQEHYLHDFSLSIWLGNLYLFRVGDLPKAEDQYDRAIKYARRTLPYYASYALLHKGLIKLNQNLPDQAAQCAASAAELSPDLAEALYQRAQYLALLCKHTDCVEQLRATLALDRLYAPKLYHDDLLAPYLDEVRPFIAHLRDTAVESLNATRAKYERAVSVLAGLQPDTDHELKQFVSDWKAFADQIRSAHDPSGLFDAVESKQLTDQAGEPLLSRLESAIRSQQRKTDSLYVEMADKRKARDNKVLRWQQVGTAGSVAIGFGGCSVITWGGDTVQILPGLITALGLILGGVLVSMTAERLLFSRKELKESERALQQEIRTLELLERAGAFFVTPGSRG